MIVNAHVIKLSVQQGIGNEQINDLLSKNGFLYAAVDHGLIQLNSKELFLVEIIPPKIYISIESVNGKKWKRDEGNIFNSDQNNIKVRMTAVAFTNQNDLVFEWKVEDLDENWNINRSDMLSFSRLSHGTYKLSVRSRNVAGVYSEVRNLTFVIKPAFWQRFEFLVFSFFILGLIIFIGFYYRLSALKKRSKKNLELVKEKSDLEIRALRAQMNPHFVFNSLTSIQYLINLKKNEEAEFYLNKFSRLLRLIVDQAGQTEITILNELDLLRIFVDLENLRYEDKFEFEVDIDNEIDIDLVLIPGIIIQPFIENAIEHGLSKKEGKGMLYLGIKKVNSSLIVIIEDDGIGREKAAELRKISGKLGNSIGVLNVKRRMELLKLGNRQDDYNFEIEDLTDVKGVACGTRIKLKLPYLLNET